MWQKTSACNVNSNCPVMCGASSQTPYMSKSICPIQPQLHFAMSWLRLIQQLRTVPPTGQPPQMKSSFQFQEQKLKTNSSKLLYHYHSKMQQINEKISKTKSTPCKFPSNKENTVKFLTNFKVSSDCHNQLSRIPNRIGPYKCKLCGTLYNGAVQLANHRCPQILSIEHRCPDCHKIFNCPANLASHRRWHKPKIKDSFNENEEDNQKLYIKSVGSLTSFNIESIINIQMSREIDKGNSDLKKIVVNQYACHLCPKSLICTSDLENHMLDHLLGNNQ